MIHLYPCTLSDGRHFASWGGGGAESFVKKRLRERAQPRNVKITFFLLYTLYYLQFDKWFTNGFSKAIYWQSFSCFWGSSLGHGLEKHYFLSCKANGIFSWLKQAGRGRQDIIGGRGDGTDNSADPGKKDPTRDLLVVAVVPSRNAAASMTLSWTYPSQSSSSWLAHLDFSAPCIIHEYILY